MIGVVLTITSVIAEDPTAGFEANTTSGNAPQAVTFRDSSINATMWEWYINADESVDSTKRNVTAMFTSSGLYSIRLRVSDGYGHSWENKTNYINISDVTPPGEVYNVTTAATFKTILWMWNNPTSADFNHTITYRDGVYDGIYSDKMAIINWSGFRELENHTMSFKSCDTSGNCNGWTNRTTNTTAWGSIPRTDFWTNKTEACVGEPITFIDFTPNFAVEWYWDFGNGVTNTTQEPTIEYNDPGLYDVKMKGSNNYGERWQNKTKYINVTSCKP